MDFRSQFTMSEQGEEEEAVVQLQISVPHSPRPTPTPPPKRVLPSGRGFGLSKPPSCMSSNAKDTLWTCGDERGAVTLMDCVGWWEGEAEDGRGLLPPPPHPSVRPTLTSPWNSARDGRKRPDFRIQSSPNKTEAPEAES